MPVSVKCPTCKRSLRAPDKFRGKRVRCNNCDTSFVLPAAQRQSASTNGGAVIEAPPQPLATETLIEPVVPPPAARDDRTMMGQLVPNSPSGRVPAAPPMPPPLRPARPRRAGWWSVILLAVLLIAGVAGGVWYFAASGPAMTLGIIEIGSTGIKGLVVRFFPTADGHDWEEKFQKDKNVNISTLADDGKTFRPEAVQELQDTLRNYLDEMRKEHKLSRDQVYIVCSSGVFTKFKGDAAAIDAGKAALEKAVQAAVNRPVDFITVQDESRYGAIACVPPRERGEALLIDIGGGNTKGGYFDEQGQFYSFEALGVKTFQEEVKKQAAKTGKPFAEVAALLRPEKLATPLRQKIEDRPGLARRPKVHMIGGAVWVLANIARPAERGLRVDLATRDITRFAALVTENKPDELRVKVLDQVTDKEVRDEAAKDLTKVQETFVPERLISGAEILKALASEFRLEGKELYFFRKGHVAWSMGYLLKKGKIVP